MSLPQRENEYSSFSETYLPTRDAQAKKKQISPFFRPFAYQRTALTLWCEGQFNSDRFYFPSFPRWEGFGGNRGEEGAYFYSDIAHAYECLALQEGRGGGGGGRLLLSAGEA